MLVVHPEALNDLRLIAQTNRVAAGALAALIEQLKCDPKLKDKLLEHGFGDDRADPISVSKWHDMFKVHQLPVWRLKSWDLELQGLKYRLIYIFNWKSREHVLLAVAPREALDYDDPRHPIRIRVLHCIKREYRNI